MVKLNIFKYKKAREFVYVYIQSDMISSSNSVNEILLDIFKLSVPIEFSIGQITRNQNNSQPFVQIPAPFSRNSVDDRSTRKSFTA